MKTRKIQFNSPEVLTYSALSLVALILSAITKGASNRLLFSAYRSSLSNPLTYLRLFTHVLGHSGYEHFINNMMLFLVIGPPMEEKYGSRDILLAIIITAFISGIVQMVFFPGIAILGASGIVFMLIVMSSLAGMKDGRIPLTLVLVLLIYLGGEIYTGITQRDNVSQLSHILGGLCGAVIGYGLESMRTGKKA